jgi:hypothetical protein
LGKLTAVFDPSVSETNQKIAQALVDAINAQTVVPVPDATINFTSDAAAFASINKIFANGYYEITDDAGNLVSKQPYYDPTTGASSDLGGFTAKDNTIFINKDYDTSTHEDDYQHVIFHEIDHIVNKGTAGSDNNLHNSNFYSHEQTLANAIGMVLQGDQGKMMDALVQRRKDSPASAPAAGIWAFKCFFTAGRWFIAG